MADTRKREDDLIVPKDATSTAYVKGLVARGQAVRLEHPRGERRVGADESGACQQRGLVTERQPADESQ